MRIDLKAIRADFLAAQQGKASAHSARTRLLPSRLQYDYLTLTTLADAVTGLLERVGKVETGAVALDLGSHRSPYRSLVESQGFELKTLDLTYDDGADYAGLAEATGLADESFDLVICTQVLEHCDNPWKAAAEIHRILKPGGHAVISAPHVWFYHPHPHDHWRFTQEGMVRLCEDAGLRPLELQAQGGRLLTLAQIVNFLLYGTLGRWGAPMYLALNLLAPRVDALIPNTLFSHNFACLARRS
jgi:SAM-dependent methyltransferase